MLYQPFGEIEFEPGTGWITGRLQEEKQEVQTHLQRADGKAQCQLMFFAAVLGGVIALTRTGVSPGAAVLLLVATLPTLAAVVLAMRVVRPNLGTGRHGGFLRYAVFLGQPATLLADLDRDVEHSHGDAAHRLSVLSALAERKYTLLAWAMDLQLVGLALALPALFFA